MTADLWTRVVGVRPVRYRLLAEPDETAENTPEDVRLYVEFDDTALVLVQGPDQIVIGIADFERFAVEVMGAVRAMAASGYEDSVEDD